MAKFVKVTKDGETIEIHPSTVENHKQLGWKIVGEPEAPAEEAAKSEAEVEKPAEKKPRRQRSSKKSKAAAEKAE